MLLGLAACLSVVYFLVAIQGTVTSPLAKDQYVNTISRQHNTENSGGDQLTIISTVDGNIHGIDQAGNKLWSASTGGPMVGAHNFESSLSDSTASTDSISEESIRTDHFLGMAPTTRNRKNYAVLPGTDGSIIYHSLDGMRKTSVTARLLAEQAPFISREGLAFSGNKKSRLMSFDVNSGELLFDTDASEQTSAVLRNRQRSLAASDKQSSPLWFGRVDYSVRAVDTLTGLEEFNITYSELHPLSYGAGEEVQDAYADEEERRLDDYKYRLEEATHTALEDVEIVGLLGSDAGGDDAEERAPPAATDHDAGSGGRASTPSLNKAGPSGKHSRDGKLGGGSITRKKEGLSKRPASSKKAALHGSAGAVSGAVGGGGGSRKARRRRKSRVRMERRAGMLEELYQEEAAPSAAAHASSASATVALISTPDGELYFSDLDGTVIEKVPASLQSPVINAFKIKRRAQPQQFPQQQLHNQHSLPSPASLPSTKRTPASGVAWDIRSINVHHRILTYAPTSALTALTAVTAGGSGGADHSHSTAQPPASIVVQSSAPMSVVHGESTSLYVLEVTDLEMPDTYLHDTPQQDSSDASQRLLPQPDAVPMISSPPAAATLPSSPSGVLSRRSGGKYTKKELLSSAEERKRLGLLRSVRGMEAHPDTNYGKVERRVAVGQHPALSDGTNGRLTSDENDAANPDEVCTAQALEVRGSSFILGVDAAPSSSLHYQQEDPMALAEEALLMTEMRASIAEAERAAAVERAERGDALSAQPPVPPHMRGSHTLRDDRYDGLLFSPDESMNMFFAMSAPNKQQQPSLSQYYANEQVNSAEELHVSGDNPRSPAVASPLSPRARLERFASKVWSIVEVALLYLAALLVFIAITFVATVFIVRVTPALAHLLPAQESFSAQLQYALQSMVGRIFALLVPAVVAPSHSTLGTVKSLSSLQSVTPLRSPLRPSESTQSTSSLGASSAGVTVRVAETGTPPLNTAPAFLSPAELPKRTEEIAGAGRVLPAESFDAEGRRLVHVGSLVVHSERVLGYGSHGTVVYRGSLHGRPLAVKRILSQFVRSADREISLLIRSDGHPNVVRYYTKEVQNDFVYLGLQLCDMTLKDFVLTVKSKTAANKPIFDKGSEEGRSSQQDQNGVTDTAISDELKGSLLQIAHGLAHLHSQRIVHRDIKPHNILCASPRDLLAADGDGASGCEDQTGAASTIADLSSYVLKISDMGLSKQLGRENFSFSSMSLSMAAMSSSALDERACLSSRTSGAENASDQARAAAMMHAAAVGTVGWQAPELISHRYVKKEPFSPAATDVSTESALLDLQEEEPPTPFSDVLAGEQGETADSDSDDVDALQDGGDDSGPPGGSAALKLSLPQLQQRQQRAKQQKDRKKRTLTVDVFSLGCVFYFTITLGEHPYGEWFEREANIAAGKVDLSLVRHDMLAVDLLSWMLHADPLLRPTSKEVCQHAFFWSPAKKLDFLVEFSDRLEQEPADSDVVLALEAGAQDVIGSRWDRRLDVLLLEDLGKYRKYDTSSVRDLLRVMRNKRHHFHELSTELKAAMGSVPGGFLSYFEDRFPRLVLHCAQVVNTYLTAEQLFKQWAACTSSVFHPKRHVQVSTPTDLKSESEPAVVVERPAAQILNGAPGTRVAEVVVWQGSALATSLQYAGWWRSGADWVAGIDAGGGTGNKKGPRPSHLSKAAADPKYRTRLCTHWESSQASNCPMRKKGKCIFAHGALELRVRENRRDKWGAHRHSGASAAATDGVPLSPAAMCLSGGEDVLGAARIADKNQAVADAVADGSSDKPGIPAGPGPNVNANEFYPSGSSPSQSTGLQFPARGNTAGTTGRGGGGGGRGAGGRASGAFSGSASQASASAVYYPQQYPAAQLYQTQLAHAQPYAYVGQEAAHYYYQQQQQHHHQLYNQQQMRLQPHQYHDLPNVSLPENYASDGTLQRNGSAHYSHT